MRDVRSGCSPPLLRSFFFLKVRSDAVQVIGQHSDPHVAFVSLLAFVGTAVESMVLKGVDVTFHGTVRVGEFAPFFAALTFAVRLAELAFFGHDYGGDFQF